MRVGIEAVHCMVVICEDDFPLRLHLLGPCHPLMNRRLQPPELGAIVGLRGKCTPP